MAEQLCERESLVIAAVRSGRWPHELNEHLARCSACLETRRITQLLLGHAAATSAQSQPVPANLVWQRLQARRRELAMRRATRCMMWMCALAAVYAMVLAVWYLPQLWHAQLASDLTPLSSGINFFGVLTAIFAVLLGSCCFAFLGSRTDFGLRS